METSPLPVKGFKFGLCSALMTFEQWGLFSVPHLYCDAGLLFIMVFSEHPWHSHLLSNVWRLSCHYLFLRHRSVSPVIQTPSLLHDRQTLLPTARPSRLLKICIKKDLLISASLRIQYYGMQLYVGMSVSKVIKTCNKYLFQEEELLQTDLICPSSFFSYLLLLRPWLWCSPAR